MVKTNEIMTFKRDQALLNLYCEQILHATKCIKEILAINGVDRTIDIEELKDITCSDTRTIELFDGGR